MGVVELREGDWLRIAPNSMAPIAFMFESREERVTALRRARSLSARIALLESSQARAPIEHRPSTNLRHQCAPRGRADNEGRSDAILYSEDATGVRRGRTGRLPTL